MLGRATSVGVPAVLIAVGLAPAAAHASFPGTNGLIAYVAVAHNCPDVHTVKADGSGDVQLTSCPAVIADPMWNAAGNRLAVAMAVGSATTPDLYTMAAGGGGIVRVTNDSVADGDPSWSKNGSVLVEGRVRSGPAPRTLRRSRPRAGRRPRSSPVRRATKRANRSSHRTAHESRSSNAPARLTTST